MKYYLIEEFDCIDFKGAELDKIVPSETLPFGNSYAFGYDGELPNLTEITKEQYDGFKVIRNKEVKESMSELQKLQIENAQLWDAVSYILNPPVV